MQDWDIVIAGGGMAGLALALSLADSNFNIAILEREEKPPLFNKKTYAPRVSALNETAKNLLTRLGAWQQMEAMRTSPYYGMEVWDGESLGSIKFDASELNLEDLGHIVENDVSVLGLLSQLTKHNNIEIKRGIWLDSMRVVKGGKRHLTLNNGEELQTSLLVGADGANSFVRELAKIDMYTWDYGHTGIVANLISEKPHQSIARQVFTKDAILAFLPLIGKNQSSIVFSVPHKLAEEALALKDKDFCQLVEKTFEEKLGKIESISARNSFELRQRNVKTYIQGGLALIGDAAHTIHPLAGQGINQGFLDVIALSETLLKASSEGENIGDLKTLKTYELRRKPDNLLMMAAMETFKRSFNNESLFLRWARNKALNFTDSQTLLKKLIVGQAASGEDRLSNKLLTKVASFF